MPRTRVLLTLAIALVLCAGWPPSASAFIEPVESSARVVKRLATDVTGDGRNDDVALRSLGSSQFRLTVTPAGSAAFASMEFTAQLTDRMPADAALYGAADLDGVAGVELIVQHWDATLATVSEAVDLSVYTWRDGRLVAEPAPVGGRIAGWHFGDGTTNQTQGYRFFDTDGHRYVDVSALNFTAIGEGRWVGRITRSVWRSGAWRKVSTRTVRLSQAQAEPYLRYDGPAVLKSILAADIDADGWLDEVHYYQQRDLTEAGTFRLTVTTAAGRRVVRTFTAIVGEPLIGTAPIDGEPGEEVLLYVSYDQPTWEVLTWRNGTLGDEPGPARCGGPAGRSWAGCSEEAFVQMTFSSQDGAAYVEFLTTSAHWDEGGTALIDRSLWQSGAWAKVSSRSEEITQEQRGALCSGFCAVAITRP